MTTEYFVMEVTGLNFQFQGIAARFWVCYYPEAELYKIKFYAMIPGVWF